MANLRVDKITSTETFEKTGSVQFDGSGDVLTVPNSADFRLGNGDFTIECWFYYKGALSSNRTLFGLFENSSARRSYQAEVRSDGTIRFEWWPDGSTGNSIDTAASTVSISTWHHYAATRTNGIITQYLNGESVASSSVGTSSFYDNTDDPFRIGALNAAVDQSFSGHISNFRIIKGVALYTSNFKPSMRELEVIPGIVLLACQSKTDASLEKTGKTITVTGNAVASELTPGILTPVVKSGGGSAITGSVEFTSTTDALVLSAGTDFAYGTGDFTIEAWIQPQGINGGETKAIFTQSQSGNDYIIFKVDSDKAIKATFGATTVSGGTVEVGSWHHVAVTRASNTVKIFVNGVASAGTTVSTDFSDTTRNPTIGQYTHAYGSIEYYGFISNLRINKGTALYTADFIPPTRELKRVPGTVLLACQDSDSPLTEATGKTITGYGRYFAATGELFANTGFTADSDWTKGGGWTIANGLATHAQGTAGDLYQSVSGLVAGQIYKLSVDIISTDNDVAYFYIDGYPGSNYITLTPSDTSPVGNHFIYFAAPAATVNIGFRGSSLFAGTITNLRLSSADHDKGASNFTPQVGDDRQITFEGVTKIDTDAYFYLPTGDTESRTLNVAFQASSSARGVFMGGLSSAPSGSVQDVMDYVTVTSIGNAVDFGNLTAATRILSSCSSTTRGVRMGGFSDPASVDVIDYITIASTGNSQDFGDLSSAKHSIGGSANSTRGLAFGSSGLTNTIEYITIASTGDSKDFGDMVDGLGQVTGTASPTRCVMAGGESPSKLNTMQYVTIMSMGNAFDFGDLTIARSGIVSLSSATRGLYLGGELPASPSYTNTVDFVQIATTGNAINFGDLDNSNGMRLGATAASPTRGLYAGGGNDQPVSNTAFTKIHLFTIASTGNATDFGDITVARFQMNNGTVSSGHGGLG